MAHRLRSLGSTAVRSLLDDARASAIPDVLGQNEHAADVERTRRAALLALVAWPLFAIVDLFSVLFVHDGRLWVMLLLRALGLAVMLPAALRLHAAPVPSRATLTALDALATGTMSFLIGISCVETGGLASPMSIGVVTLLVARSALLADRVERSLPAVAAGAIAFPVAIASLLAVAPEVRAQLFDAHAVGTFLLGVISSSRRRR